MSTLYLIRHAQASFGKTDYDALSELGHIQARILAGHLMKMGMAFQVVITGTLKRHQETAQALLDQLAAVGGALPEVRQWPAFNEYDSEAALKKILPVMVERDPEIGRQAALMFDDARSFQLVFKKVMQAWAAGDYAWPDLETWPDFTGRVRTAIDKIMSEDGKGRNIVVFTSGGPISAAVQKALALSNAETLGLGWQVANASITRFKYTSERITLSTFNEYAHLETAGRNGLVTYR